MKSTRCKDRNEIIIKIKEPEETEEGDMERRDMFRESRDESRDTAHNTRDGRIMMKEKRST